MYHTKAAEKMTLSQQPPGNILTAAHRKIADSIDSGKAIKIEGGV